MRALNRRQFLGRAAAGSGLLALTAGTIGVAGCSGTSAQVEKTQKGKATSSSGKTSSEDTYAKQVDEGLAYFRKRADEQLPLAEELVGAVSSGDLGRAKEAYVAARPPYEEIEVLAAGFEETDSDIDARPYDFDVGERSKDFKGFHRIEALLFRDGDLEAARPYARELVKSVETLRDQLDQRQNFGATMSFEGMVALATEVASKKISSEEETYSGQSLLIFKHNWGGIFRLFEPFSEEVEQRDEKSAIEVEEAYQGANALLAPYFSAGEAAAEPYGQVELAKRGEIVRASYHLSDTLSQAASVLGLAA